MFAAKRHRRPELLDDSAMGMDVALIVILFLTALTGLALLLLRNTGAMRVLLALHLGVDFALFITMPSGRLVHGIYSLVPLVRYAAERKHHV